MVRSNILQALFASFGERALRFGLFIALYFALYKALEELIQRYRKKVDSWNAFISGALSSVAILVEPEDSRWILAQYLSVRAIGTAVFNLLQKYPKLKTWSYYGDALVFALCSGQAVYSFVVRPDTVDPAYAQFLTNVTQMDPLVIRLFQRHMQTGGLDPDVVGKLGKKWAQQGIDLKELIDGSHNNVLTCQIIHPLKGCWHRIFWILYANFKMVFPMYFSLHLVPTLLFKKGSQALNAAFKSSLLNGIQSSSFMSGYVGIFQTLLCMQRNLMSLGVIKQEWRYAFWWMGFLSAASIFIEKKSRRAELVLYVT